MGWECRCGCCSLHLGNYHQCWLDEGVILPGGLRRARMLDCIRLHYLCMPYWPLYFFASRRCARSCLAPKSGRQHHLSLGDMIGGPRMPPSGG